MVTTLSSSPITGLSLAEIVYPNGRAVLSIKTTFMMSVWPNMALLIAFLREAIRHAYSLAA